LFDKSSLIYKHNEVQASVVNKSQDQGQVHDLQGQAQVQALTSLV